ncbi:MAG: hypothetical protein ABSB97_06690, partial [Thermoplasmata archaeon]
IGKDRTREDHRGVADQLFASYATGKDQRALSAIVGEEALSATDRTYLKVADRFENEFVNQRPDEDRSIDQSLAIAWKILSDLPDSELKRIRPEFIAKYHGIRLGEGSLGTGGDILTDLTETDLKPVKRSPKSRSSRMGPGV